MSNTGLERDSTSLRRECGCGAVAGSARDATERRPRRRARQSATAHSNCAEKQRIPRRAPRPARPAGRGLRWASGCGGCAVCRARAARARRACVRKFCVSTTKPHDSVLSLLGLRAHAHTVSPHSLCVYQALSAWAASEKSSILRQLTAREIATRHTMYKFERGSSRKCRRYSSIPGCQYSPTTKEPRTQDSALRKS